jgi:hypothetical protein
VVRAFVKDMCAFFAEPSPHKRDEIAARQATALDRYMSPRAKSLRLLEIKELFYAMKDDA